LYQEYRVIGLVCWNKFAFLPCKAGKPVLLKEARVALTKGKSIRFAGALLVIAGFEGSDSCPFLLCVGLFIGI